MKLWLAPPWLFPLVYLGIPVGFFGGFIWKGELGAIALLTPSVVAYAFFSPVFDRGEAEKRRGQLGHDPREILRSDDDWVRARRRALIAGAGMVALFVLRDWWALRHLPFPYDADAEG